MCAKRRKKLTAKRLVTLLAVLLLAAASAIYERLSPAVAAEPMNMGSAAELRVLDVGQGSSTLLLSKGGEGVLAVLIDGGETTAGEAVLNELAAANVDEIELVILTHPHSDHFGGLTDVLQKHKVKILIAPAVPKELTPTNSSYENFLDAVIENGCDYETVTAARDYAFGDVSLKILNGFANDPQDLNDTSLCMRIDAGEASFLITGDGEAAVEDALRLSGEPIDADILVAGHHGSNTSSKQYFLNAVTPKASAISCGANNKYNLPSEKAVKRLAEFGNIYRTDIIGTICFSTDGSMINVSAKDISDSISAK